MKWPLLAKLFVIAAACQTSCSFFRRFPERDCVAEGYRYSDAMAAVRKSVTREGIPRGKVFYHFQLGGVPSVRSGPGSVRGGWTAATEIWNLPGGTRLTAYRWIHVGRDSSITPFKEGDGPFVEGAMMLKEKYYHEPPLEPYFNELLLHDSRGKQIDAIRLKR